MADTKPSAAAAAEPEHPVAANPTGEDLPVYFLAKSHLTVATNPQLSIPTPISAADRRALFSTDFGRKEKRKLMPPYPPVIVRSDKIRGVVDYALYWLNERPEVYLCVFPQCGWIIDDLWDDYDIHLNSPSFLRDALTFITRDNVHRAKRFAYEWSEKYPGRVELLGGDTPSLYDWNDPLAIVDKVFVNGETDMWPRTFLWHAGNMMRMGMHIVERQQREVSVGVANAQGTSLTGVASAQGVSDSHGMDETTSNDDGKSSLKDKPAVEQEKSIAADENQAVPGRDNSEAGLSCETGKEIQKASRKRPMKLINYPAIPLPDEPVPSMSVDTQSSSIQATPAQLHGHSHAQPQLPRPELPNHKQIAPQSGPPSTMASPFMHPQNIRNTKSRQGRSISGSYNQSMSMPPQSFTQSFPTGGWGENVPSSQRPQQPSSNLPTLQSPVVQPAFMAQQAMFQHMNSMGPFQPGQPIMLPPMAGNGPMPSNPLSHVPMLSSSSHSLGQGGPPHNTTMMDQAQQNHPPSPYTPRSISIGDVANDAYMNCQQRIDQTSYPSRRGGRGEKQPSLFNPYGQDRPDFVNIPPQPLGRKPVPNTLLSVGPRNRRFSVGPRGQGAYGHYNQDHGAIHSGPPTTSLSYPQQHTQLVPDPSVTGDQVFGCDETWIGPQNNTVTSLWLAQLPPDVTDHDLREMFGSTLGLHLTNVRTQFDRRGEVIAYVSFATSAEARQGLQLHNYMMRGKAVTVKVPKTCYSKEDPAYRRQHPNQPGFLPRGNGRASQGARRMSYGQANVKAGDEPSSLPQPSYSPQDVRSGLQGHPIQDTMTGKGSPEIPKRKKNKSPKKTKSERKDEESIGLAQIGEKEQVLPSIENISPEARLTPEINDREIAAIAKQRESHPGPAIHVLNQHDTKAPVGDLTWPKPEDTLNEPFQESTELSRGPPELESSVMHVKDTQHDVAKELPSTDKPKSALSSAESLNPTIDKEVCEEQHSDDEQKHDLSFHSAIESQSEAVQPEIFEATSPAVQQPSSIYVEPPSASRPANTYQQHETVEEVFESKVGQAEGPVISSVTRSQQASGILTIQETKVSPSAEKKAGVKQTESLFPFAKSKAQARKEKNAKKKEKKKAQAEKASPFTKPVDGIAAKDKPALSQAGSTTSSEQMKGPTLLKASDIGHRRIPSIHSTGDPFDKDNVSIATATASATTAEQNVESDPNSGGKASSPSDNASIGPQDFKAHPGSSVQDDRQEAQAPPGADALSLKSSSIPTSSNASDTPSLVSARTQPSVKAYTQEQMKKKTLIREKVAIPSLTLLTRKASPSAKPLSDNTSPAESAQVDISNLSANPVTSEHLIPGILENPNMATEISRTDTEKGLTLQSYAAARTNRMLLEIAATDNVQMDSVSTASSTTLRGVSPPIISPCSTAVDFHTPTQTLTALVASQSQPLKKPKNKKKKKKNQDSAEITSARILGAEGEAFSEQITHVDGLINQHEPTVSYYGRNDNQTVPLEQSSYKGESEEF
ncbi:hypothetical protein CC78DRAFT_274712 [Lojkania enalia]|uniref:RRM domain-containing protein n=1 Tax=Lojkania enalia TaxID=147567 RepID=A0A9P4KC84_9PLEO|nr:hypothetical protein CC78DRAFT_274712 [Didymosphaeria enalia]